MKNTKNGKKQRGEQNGENIIYFFSIDGVGSFASEKNYDIYYRKNCLRLIALYIFLGVDLIGANIEAIIRRKTHYLLIWSDENLLRFPAVFVRDYENASYDTFECFLRDT